MICISFSHCVCIAYSRHIQPRIQPFMLHTPDIETGATPANQFPVGLQGLLHQLRDQGLKYNPNETLIYRELAWFFQHKMGQNLDDANMTYKQGWANEMAQVFAKKKPTWTSSSTRRPTNSGNALNSSAKLIRWIRSS